MSHHHRTAAELVDDRPADGVFRIHRDLFRDPAVFAQEMERVFEGTWNFVGLESQVAKPNDFFTTHIGRQPVLVTRDSDGLVHAFLNTCRHRGAVVCPFRKGRAKFHVCRYHGWAYDSAGRNTLVTDHATGQYPDAFDAEGHDLMPVARFGNYRGLLFASLSPDVPALEEHLGEARGMLDLVLDQSSTGWEFVPGPVNYTYDGNWKLQFENGLDFYHFASTHSSYMDVLAQRAKRNPPAVKAPPEPDPEEQGSFSFAHGHSVMWSIRNPPRGLRPLAFDRARLEEVRARVGEERAKWMLRQRNLTIFPNLQIIDIVSLQLRTWRPLAPDRTEMVSHCLAPIGEEAEARRLRIRQYEDFFNPTGLATSDDNVMYEYCQSGYAADADGWTQGYARGMGGAAAAPSLVSGIGIAPLAEARGPVTFGDETCFHAGYREWRRLMLRGAEA
ncbi:aromatic ring-hydroxylating oxygenase subunit alpha [Roseomonas populi]|uniref:Aromatic ring-hydroxylating dioxygenase subunit alpha n=1 Tax=Roseomonas populi TaxID=3121582 RepID=A0ABT1XCJ7_9PROT|nr:aromatic ring-hydroxylating dioxygenase subunit alpha [Roseomonas pecuniae]MCR0985434.1 aromatic ring-hydroxylating dioxygenase subunit alpha [Roseomonas pecuniae]